MLSESCSVSGQYRDQRGMDPICVCEWQLTSCTPLCSPVPRCFENKHCSLDICSFLSGTTFSKPVHCGSLGGHELTATVAKYVSNKLSAPNGAIVSHCRALCSPGAVTTSILATLPRITFNMQISCPWCGAVWDVKRIWADAVWPRERLGGHIVPIRRKWRDSSTHFPLYSHWHCSSSPSFTSHHHPCLTTAASQTV